MQGVVNEEFKMMGLSTRGDAMAAVVDFLERCDDPHAALSQMLDELDAKALSTSIVDLRCAEEVIHAVDKLNGTGAFAAPDGTGTAALLDDEDGITIVDAFDMPRYGYDTQRKVFHENVSKEKTINAGAESKIELYRERFHLLQQRVARHRMFVKPAFNAGGAAAQRTYCELTPLTGLLGHSVGTKYVMGCLSQLEDDRFFLEDLTGQIQVDVSNAATSSGLYTENCIVVAEGEVRKADGVLEVRALGFPPAESREDTRNATNFIDFIGAGRLRPKDIERMVEEEAASTSDMFVVLSDVWLDRESTFTRLRTVFEGFDSLDAIPSMFVLMGDFSSKPFGPTHFGFVEYSKGFDKLAELVREFPAFKARGAVGDRPGSRRPRRDVGAAQAAADAVAHERAARRAAPGDVHLEPRARQVSIPGPRVPARGLTVAHAPQLHPAPRGHRGYTRRTGLRSSRLSEKRWKESPGTSAAPSEEPRSAPRNSAAWAWKSAARGAVTRTRSPTARPPRTYSTPRWRRKPTTRTTKTRRTTRTLNDEDVVSDDEVSEDEEETDEEANEWENRPLFRHLAATLVQQAHLAPLPIAQLPVYWEHDHALRLYPAPHCVVLGDRTEQQALAKFEDTELVNPGCFADDGSFAVYRPATREVEFSAV
jgi:DNA polymerase epsilon subunit 2